MDTNLLFGYILMGLGVLAMTGGTAIAIVEALRPRAAAESVIGDVGDLLAAIAKVLEALGKLGGGAQLCVLGIAIFAGGAYLVAAKPL
jgi:hypothetical protein